MQACGNDFIIIDEIKDQTIPENMRSILAQKLCKRNFSVGANDVLFIIPSCEANAQLRIFEPDGSEADMCGNGIRCVAKYLIERENFPNPLKIKTRAGIKTIEKNGKFFKVDMGIVTEPLRRNYIVKNIFINAFFVNSGEPHIVVFIDDISSVRIVELARNIRYSDEFTKTGVNVNFVQIFDRNRIRIRTYERGIEDETKSCGTGATASAFVASKILGLQMPIDVETNGGILVVKTHDHHAYLEGPAEFVFDGITQLDHVRLSDVNV